MNQPEQLAFASHPGMKLSSGITSRGRDIWPLSVNCSNALVEAALRMGDLLDPASSCWIVLRSSSSVPA